jgi:hypothetical protein
MPEQITQRILWRVAQSQYGPIGLLSVYMIKPPRDEQHIEPTPMVFGDG